MNTKFLEEMLETMSVSGYEEELQAKVSAYTQDVADEIITDETGNVISVINPKAEKRILLSGHIDEIGMVISNIQNDGFLRVVKAGGIRPVLYLGSHVNIKHEDKIISGVVVTNSDLVDKAKIKDSDLIIDIGVNSKEEALKYVSVGDSVCAATDYKYLVNDRLAARALDDRIGAFIVLEVLREAKKRGCKNGIYALTAVGEETTCRGAYWGSQTVKPHEAFAIDVTYATDYPGSNPNASGDIKIGGGPAICHSSIVSKRMNKKLISLAKDLDIKLQEEVSPAYTYTDADKIHFSNDGVATALVSIPLRYMHSSVEVLSLKDVQEIIDLLTEYVCAE